MRRTSLNFLFILFIVLFAACGGREKADDRPGRNVSEEIVKLTDLVKDVYKWHATEKNQIEGFTPKKSHPSDSLYSGIDLNSTDSAITQMKETGFFAKEFLDNYRKIAVNIDKELHNGSLTWREGDMAPFGESDSWCNCQDGPDNYWEKLKLLKVRFKSDHVKFM